MATDGQRKAAEELRREGNQLFQKRKYAAAADRYTEAIALDNTCAPLFVNRALCSKKQAVAAAAECGDEAPVAAGGEAGRAGWHLWSKVAADAKRALVLDVSNLKAHYLVGVAMREQGDDLKQAIGHLSKALAEARLKDDAIQDEIWWVAFTGWVLSVR